MRSRQFDPVREPAVTQYQNFVRAGVGLPPIWHNLKNQIFLGDSAFVENCNGKLKPIRGIWPKSLKPNAGSRPNHLATMEAFPSSQDGMRNAFVTGDYTLQQIAQAFGVHYSTVSRVVNKRKHRYA